MKLARKLTLALIVGMGGVFVVHAWFAVNREVDYAELNMKRDAHIQGRALRTVLGEIWRRDGQARALQMIDDFNEEGSPVRIRWVWINAPDGDPYAPRAPRAALSRVALGEEVLYRVPGRDLIRIYVPAPIERGRPGALEFSESTTGIKRYVSSTVRNHVVTTVAMAAVCGAMAMLMGGWFVGRPIRSLVLKARRVGAGDLSGPLILRQRDEIRVLADEMNAMCDRLRLAGDQLRHADRLMTVGKLASGIAHELGTPLNVVGGRARMIAAGDDVAESAAVIVEQTQKMTTIIRQLLDFARRRHAHKSPQDMTQLARQTAFLLEPMADKRRVQLVVDVPDGETFTADVDATQLQQALANLVVNGIQAMTEPGDITIALRRAHASPPADHAGPAGEYLCLSVTDQGAGMTADTIAHVFEPFFTTKPIGEGTGLGLSVTYGIVQEHQGWITVESEVGKGTCFAIWLPVVEVVA